MRQEHNTYDLSGDEASSPQPTEPDPPKAQENVFRLLRLVGSSRENETALHELKVKLGLRQLIGQSPAFLAVVSKIPALARCEATVLISGETGTGKEVCARAIHYLSPRAAKPFVPVNCGAIPTELIENELFGHERGAYTDAGPSHPGVIAEAEDGTLFLDEIDCLPLLAQVKLLRFLQEKEFRPLGANKTTKASVRVIAATNSNLEEAIQQGKLRRDLYYRINILPLVLPPLRDRREDIVLLARYFLDKFAREFDKRVSDFSPEVLGMLRVYSWPGNIRELEHTIERAVALADHATLSTEDVALLSVPVQAPPEAFQAAKDLLVQQFEKDYLREILLAHKGNITKAAKAAGKNRRAFWQLLQKHGFSTHSLPITQASNMDER